MNRFWGQALAAAALTTTVGGSLPACAHNDASLFVHGVLAPPVATGNTCTYVADPTTPTISRGLVDAALRDNYSPEFLIGSTLVPQGNATTPNSETARIEIQGTLVRVVDPVDNSTWMNNTVLTAGIVEPAAGVTPAYTAIGSTIMDLAALNHFKPSIGSPTKLAVVYIKFFGQTLGGQNLESNEFQFPVDVCNGCLVSRPANAATTNYCSGAVPAVSTAAPCAIGQDQYVDCQKCYPLAPCQ